MEEYLIVTENDSKFLPDPSHCQKGKKSFFIPAGFCLDSEFLCKQSTPLEKAGETKNEIDNSVKSDNLCQLSNQEQKRLNINFLQTEATGQSQSNYESSIRAVTDSSYVDIQRHLENIKEVDAKLVGYCKVKEVNGDNILILEKNNLPFNSFDYMDVQGQENISEDYSRVKEVDSDNTVLLQKQNVTADTYCQERGTHNTNIVLHKPGNPNMTGPHTEEVCKDLDSGYVDTIPAAPLI